MLLHNRNSSNGTHYPLSGRYRYSIHYTQTAKCIVRKGKPVLVSDLSSEIVFFFPIFSTFPDKERQEKKMARLCYKLMEKASFKKILLIGRLWE